MAHITEVIGAYSEKLAEVALMASGYTVLKPTTAEPYDYVALGSGNRTLKVQVKTIRIRNDRNNELVIVATNGSGALYSEEDVDCFIGVLGGDQPRVFMLANRGIKEYWSTLDRAPKRWLELPLGLNRGGDSNGRV